MSTRTSSASARAIVVTGTHFSQPNSDAAQRKAIRIAKANGGKVVFDIDYRPNLWGLAGHAEGFERYVKSDHVSSRLKTVLPDCDLIVGTEEEIMIASGADDVLGALKTIRSLSSATIVLKRGAMGCIVYDGAISDDLEDGIVGKGFPIEIYNVLGAGDAFMSGFLRGWLGGESLQTAATWANACGAFAVSRLLCAPEYPSFEELQYLPEERQPASRAAQGRGAQPHPLGDDAPQRRPVADGARLRPSHPARGDRRPCRRRSRRASAISRCWPSRPRRASPMAGPATACCSTRSTAARRCSNTPGTAFPGSAGRSNCRARARCASSSARTSARSWSNGRSITASSACASTTRTIPPS